MGKLWQLSQGHPEPAFSGKVQKGDGEKFSKNRLQSSPCLKSPIKLRTKWHYSLVNMHLKCKEFGAKKRLQKCPNGQVIAILTRSPKTRIF